uniref:YncE family protein n=1 Tax=Eiseniibacteriota bacterium TaxID=2212470 RepID=A0A832MKZ4_UNCEI
MRLPVLLAAALACAALAAPGPRAGASGPARAATPAVAAGLLIVLNKSGHEAALVDPVRLEVVARLPTGKGPHEVAVSPDGRRAFVADYGAYAVFKEGSGPPTNRAARSRCSTSNGAASRPPGTSVLTAARTASRRAATARSCG